ncbi:hypothetical protein HMPREF1568_0438 [Providencia alcalifaciens PAL-3]|nr:hypothetical protein HMPREF1568_0438 [Providencia alcalifaciens PAL-3]
MHCDNTVPPRQLSEYVIDLALKRQIILHLQTLFSVVYLKKVYLRK